jgi:hypothetical protein
MKTALLALGAFVAATTFANASCEMKHPIHAHAEPSTKSLVLDGVISGEVGIRVQKRGWSYVEMWGQKDDATWGTIRSGWVRSDQVRCLE